jgi:hypothetical protein
LYTKLKLPAPYKNKLTQKSLCSPKKQQSLIQKKKLFHTKKVEIQDYGLICKLWTKISKTKSRHLATTAMRRKTWDWIWTKKQRWGKGIPRVLGRGRRRRRRVLRPHLPSSGGDPPYCTLMPGRLVHDRDSSANRRCWIFLQRWKMTLPPSGSVTDLMFSFLFLEEKSRSNMPQSLQELIEIFYDTQYHLTVVR